jgi:hypothetical protein
MLPSTPISREGTVNQLDLLCHQCADPDVVSELGLCADCHLELLDWLDEDDWPEIETRDQEDVRVTERYL